MTVDCGGMTPATFLEAFQRAANRHPAGIALVENGERSLTYEEVLLRSAGLAQRILEAGSGPGKLVGVHGAKSIDLVIAILATWWAGAAYTPLDPATPAERRRFLVEDAGLSLIVDTDEPAHDLSLGNIPRIHAQPAESGSFTGLPGPCLEGLAYLIYTSGSTGRPKGVMIPHRGLVPLLEAQIAAFGLSPASRSLFFLSIGFDASLSDIGTALLSGATLLIEEPGALVPGPGLARRIEEREITFVDLPPRILSLMDPEEMPDCLETIVIGGEVCPAERVRRWAKRFRLINGYGPTEATICTSMMHCDPDRWDRALIGQPLPHVRYRILDEEGSECAPEKPGNLHIGGPCLARGYHDRPELEARKFLQIDGDRFYRTDDRIVRHPDGALEFLGRMDRQLKLGGIRVEPAEIEARLEEIPGILAAAVLLRPIGGPRSRTILVAFLEVGEIRDVDGPRSRNHLVRFLPRWMIPHRFVIRPSLPRSPSGKLDLGALMEMPLDPPPASLGTRETALPPLGEIWREVLQISDLGLDDDLYELGVDSITVLEVAARAETRGVAADPVRMMNARTLAQMIDPGPRSAHPAHPVPAARGRLAEEIRARLTWDEPWASLLARATRRASFPLRHPGTLLVTGATGFLGTRLLGELLERTEATIHSLVRAPTPGAARDRLDRALENAGIVLDAGRYRRLRIWPGDLAKPGAGMDPELREELAESVDAIYHAADQVHLLLDVDSLWQTHVEGARGLVGLMLQGRPKHLHLVSTLPVFVSAEPCEGRLLESDDLARTRVIHGGYAQTKWATEVLLRMLGDTAGPISFYRPGLLCGDSTTGVGAPGDFFARFARGLASLGVVPCDCGELRVDVTPIDFAARAIAVLSLHDMEVRTAGTYHVCNPESLTLAGLLGSLREHGIRLDEVTPGDFLARFRQPQAGIRRNDRDAAAAAACLALCRALPGADAFERLRVMDLFQATGVIFDMRRTLSVLEGRGPVCPPPSPELLASYWRHVFQESDPT